VIAPLHRWLTLHQNAESTALNDIHASREYSWCIGRSNLRLSILHREKSPSLLVQVFDVSEIMGLIPAGRFAWFS